VQRGGSVQDRRKEGENHQVYCNRKKGVVGGLVKGPELLTKGSAETDRFEEGKESDGMSGGLKSHCRTIFSCGRGKKSFFGF